MACLVSKKVCIEHPYVMIMCVFITPYGCAVYILNEGVLLHCGVV